MMREVPSHVDADSLERDILLYWDQEAIFQQSLEQHKDKVPFIFYDGPPYATGKPHYGHVLQSAIKDTVLRYKTMQGYYVPRRVGWDTHGLPIENIVEKELCIKTKRDIEQDIEGFNKKCKETVYLYIDEFRSTLKRIGRWADYGNEYSTLDRSYMEAEWGVFQQVWNKDLIYKSFRSTPYCIRCATPLSNFEVGMAYKDVKDMSVYVSLQTDPEQGRGVKFGSSTSSESNKKQQLLVWTTTPWTLPANVAVAYNPELAYVVVKNDDQEYILAKDRVSHVFGDDVEFVRDIPSEELASLTYEPLFDSVLTEEEKTKSFRLVPSSHVSAQDGTGLVHMAPAFGEEDFNVAKKEELPIYRTVDNLGNFNTDIPIWGGRNIFECQKEIMKDLDTRGLLFKRELIEHSYPFCWRCDTPLIYMALDSWFLKVSALKEKMLKLNEDIHWVPEHVKTGRFAKGIESAPDWAISRNRFWSVPMPIWECDVCNERECIGSVAELQEKSGASDEQVQDIHRPYVDDITWACEKCLSRKDADASTGLHIQGTLRRISEVLDVWFDSGCMPYATNQQGYPADFIVESIEMTRAWFYVLHVLSTALHDKPAFKNVIASGLIFAEDGQKLSKKLKNYPEIEPTLKTYGADVLRFYLLSSTALGEPYKFSEKDMRQVQRNVYMTLWNVYSMFTRYAKVHEWKKKEIISENQLDMWILARTNKLVADVITHTDAYRIDTASREFITYIDDLSNWYVRRSRTRMQHPSSDQERDEVFGTLYEVLVTVSKTLAPFMPFLAEDMYRNLTGEASVHLASFPRFAKALPAGQAGSQGKPDDQEILDRTKAVRDAISFGLALRAKEKVKVRQPLQRFSIAKNTNKNFTPDDFAMIQEEMNVKEVVVSDSDVTELDTEITSELKAEGIARDIIRHGQGMRKNAGYALDDKISVAITTDDADINSAIATHTDMIAQALQAENILDVLDTSDAHEEVKIGGSVVSISIKKL